MRETLSRRAFLTNTFGVAAIAAFDGDVLQAAKPEKDSAAEIDRIIKEMGSATHMQLVTLLDHNTWIVRDTAAKHMHERGDHELKTRGRKPTWSSDIVPRFDKEQQRWFLHPEGEAALPISAEQKQSLQRFHRALDRTESEHLLVGTHCDIPTEAMTVETLLSKLGRQIGCPLRIHDPSGTDAKQFVRAKSADLWTILNTVRFPDGRKLLVTHSSATGIDLLPVPADSIDTASEGSLYATLNRTNGLLRLGMEPKANIHRWHLDEFRVDGKKQLYRFDRHFSADGYWIYLPDQTTPLLERQALQFDLRTEHVHTRRHHITNVDEPQRITSGGFTYEFKGLKKDPDELGNYAAALGYPPEAHDYCGEWNLCTCRGADGQGNPIPMVSNVTDHSGIRWYFDDSRPTQLWITIPDQESHDGEATIEF